MVLTVAEVTVAADAVAEAAVVVRLEEVGLAQVVKEKVAIEAMAEVVVL